jgi:mannosyltransferase
VATTDAVTGAARPGVRGRWVRVAKVDPRVTLGAATAVAVATCFTALGRQPLSWDESVSANAAGRGLPALLRLLRHTDAPLGPYYLLLHWWVRLLSGAGVRPTEAWLRAPSAAAAVVTVAVVAYLGTRLAGPVTGLVAGVVLAVDPLFVFYAHDARPYALATMCVAVATLALFIWLDRPRPEALVGYAVAMTAAAYLQLFAIFVLAAHALVMVRHRAGRQFAVPVVAVLAAVAPLALASAGQTGEISWVPPPDPESVGSFLVRVAGGPMAPTFALVACAALVRWRRGRPPGVRGRVLAAGAAVPPLALVAASAVQPLTVARYALVCVPALALGAALVIRRAPRRVALLAVAALVLPGLVASVAQQAAAYKYEDYRAAADAMLDTSRSGDGMLFVPSSARVGIDGYLRPDGHERSVAVPTDLALLDPASVASGELIGGDECPAPAVPAVVNRPRIYLIGDDLVDARDNPIGSADRAKAEVLAERYTIAWSRRFGEVTVTLLIRSVRPGGSA